MLNCNLKKRLHITSWDGWPYMLARYILAFFIPVIIVGIVYKAMEIAPFGDNSILSMDLWGEYFPMYKYNFKDAESLSELLYNWNGGLGVNNLAQSAYYCNSILFILMKFFPLSSMAVVLDVICWAKFGLSSVTCLFFLEKKLESKNILLLVGTISYSLCAYAYAYLNQCMWTDCIIYAPLIFYGLDRLMKQKKPLVYIVILALTMFSSFFISYSMCICIAIYFLFSLFCQFRLEKGKRFFRLQNAKEHLYTFLRFAGASILAAGIAAIILIPTALCLGNTMVSDSEFPSQIEWYNTLSEYLNAMLPTTVPSLVYGIPNIATGIFVFLLVPMYFLNSKIAYREKFFAALYLFILYVAMNTSTFNYIWHGFVFPNQLPGRWSFMVSLTLVFLSMRGLVKKDGLKCKTVISSLIFGILLLVISQISEPKLEKEQLRTYMLAIVIFSAGLLLIKLVKYLSVCSIKKKNIYAQMAMETAQQLTVQQNQQEKMQMHSESKEKNLADINDVKNITDDNSEKLKQKLTEYEKKKRQHQKFSVVMRITAFGCAVLVMTFSVFRLGKDFVTVNGEDNFKKSDLISYNKSLEMLDRYGKDVDCGDEDFYRAVANSGYTFNSGMIGNYKDVGYYSSTMMGGTFQLLKYMGNRVYADMRSSVYNIGSPVQNSLFGVKYVIDRDRTLDYILPNTTVVKEYEDCNIREISTALPLAYAVSSDIMKYRMDDQIRGIRNQNQFVNQIMGEDVNVFEKIEPSTPVSAENAELGYSDDWNSNYFFTEEGQTQAKVFYTFTCPKSGPYFAEQNFRAGTLKATASNGNNVEFDVGSDKFKYLGTFEEGDTISVEAVIDNVSIGCYGFDLYWYDQEEWQKCCDQLRDKGLQVTSFQNTKVEGTITLDRSEMVMATIPQDGGWSVYCDGDKLETSEVAGTLLSFVVPAGTHTIQFRYHMPGLALGTSVAICSILITILWVSPKLRVFMVEKIKRRKKKIKSNMKDQESETDETNGSSETLSDL